MTSIRGIRGKWLRYSVRALGALVVIAIAAYAFGPSFLSAGMRIGGVPSPPPESWLAVNEHDTLMVETRGTIPWVVYASYAATEDGLYVAALRWARWQKRVNRDPEARVRIGDATYEVVAVPVTDPEEIGLAVTAFAAKAQDVPEIFAEQSALFLEEARENVVYQMLRFDPRR